MLQSRHKRKPPGFTVAKHLVTFYFSFSAKLLESFHSNRACGRNAGRRRVGRLLDTRRVRHAPPPPPPPPKPTSRRQRCPAVSSKRDRSVCLHRKLEPTLFPHRNASNHTPCTGDIRQLHSVPTFLCHPVYLYDLLQTMAGFLVQTTRPDVDLSVSPFTPPPPRGRPRAALLLLIYRPTCSLPPPSASAPSHEPPTPGAVAVAVAEPTHPPPPASLPWASARETRDTVLTGGGGGRR
ncbi:ras-associated and pleckstrin homology domains-containing protein 1-like [Cylas formicarius]|uniref:ras-associated and pleckstrin homology domains-containing protein 1-like n=1 Tax=Cylas formicarius TaxID=197179 RepID=UPI002958B7CC|nr:ras-associated and pleckstrin homology domains-containing protein 1-like [Cylas formicarius]